MNRIGAMHSRLQASGLIFAIALAFTWVAAPASESGPRRQVIDGVEYWIVAARPEAVRVVWKDSEGRQLRTIPEAARFLAGSGEKVETVMNGGIFEPGGVPSGLLVQGGREWQPVNRREGKGNFYLKPNGIFLVGSRGAMVMATEDYPESSSGVREAVQSGPLLLQKGRIHPRFNAGSTSRLHRNGVGIHRESGAVVFVMTDFRSPKFPNLHEFARVFQSLGCDDALFLDGDLSQMRTADELDRPTNHFGSMIAIVRTGGDDAGDTDSAPESE